MKNIELTDILNASSVFFFFIGVILMTQDFFAGLLFLGGAVACSTIIRQRIFEQLFPGSGQMKMLGKAAFFVSTYCLVVASSAMKHFVFNREPQQVVQKAASKAEPQATETTKPTAQATAKPITQATPKPEKPASEIARPIYEALPGIIAEGRAMESLRKAADTEGLRRCGEKMRSLSEKTKAMRKQSDKLPGAYILLKTAVVESDLCITCSDSALEYCEMAQSTLSQFSMP